MWLTSSTVLERMQSVSYIVSLCNLVILWIAYRVAIAIYNISPLHPLFRFPGPKLAAMGYGYEAYYDFILVGRYTREIQRMHEKYGKQNIRGMSYRQTCVRPLTTC